MTETTQTHEITGLRAAESNRRFAHAMEAGPLYRASTGWRCTPIIGWSSDDVWAVIAGWRLPYNAAYDVLDAAGVHRDHARVGPLPLARGRDLREGWPEMHERLVARYGNRWEE